MNPKLEAVLSLSSMDAIANAAWNEGRREAFREVLDLLDDISEPESGDVAEAKTRIAELAEKEPK